MKTYTILLIILMSCFAVAAQKDSSSEIKEDVKIQITKDSPEMILAKNTLKAHGGDKFKNMKTLTVRGSVDVTASVFPQAIPATFVTVYAGDKYRLEINNPIQPFKQVYDGAKTSSSVERGFSLPPINRLGLPLLQKIGEEGYNISPLEDKKKNGFRITSPEGFYTDFIIDKKSGQVKSYDSSYTINNSTIKTSVAIDKYKVVDEVVVPEKYAQRFDLPQFTIYAEFKAKEISVNSEVADDVFTLN